MVRQYQLALDSLSDNCRDTEEELGTYAADAQAHMAENGVDESVFNILSAVNEGFFGQDGVDSCRDRFAAYAIFRS